MKKILTVFVLLLASMSAVAQTERRPHLRLKNINGRTITLDSYKGRVLLINFWATWCIPCRAEIPDLIKKQRQYRNQGLRILGITYPPERISEVRSFGRRLRMNYPVAIGTKETKARFTASETLPMTIVIDREGIVRDVIEGTMYADEFDEKVKPLLSIETPTPVKKPRGSSKPASR